MRATHRFGLVIGALVLAGCAAREPEATRSTPPADSATAAVADLGLLQPITAASVLALAADGRARATVVNVWATWCLPCREEFPELLEAARAHRADGVRLVLVSTDFDEQLPEVRRFLSGHDVRDTTYLKHDADQTFINTLNRDWTGTIPATLVYDAQGRRVAFWEGRADRARFEAAINKALDAVPHPS